MPRPSIKSSLSFTKVLANTATSKLWKEASLPVHRLRYLVCHANMLDAITLSLDEVQLDQMNTATSMKDQDIVTPLSEAPAKRPYVCEASLDHVVDAEAHSEIPASTMDSLIDSKTAGLEVMDSIASCNSEVLDEIGYGLEKTISRRAGETAESDINRVSPPALESRATDNVVLGKNALRSPPKVHFENQMVAGLA